MSDDGVQIGERLARIETKLDAVLRECPESQRRIRTLEDSRTRAGAYLAVVALVWAPLVAVAVRYVAQVLGG